MNIRNLLLGLACVGLILAFVAARRPLRDGLGRSSTRHAVRLLEGLDRTVRTWQTLDHDSAAHTSPSPPAPSRPRS